MTTAILGWGSLVWDPRDLAGHILNGNLGEAAWQLNGPVLPLEFSRVSGPETLRYLSLVIDPDHGSKVPTRFVRSTRAELEDTIADLRCREGTPVRSIGFVDLGTHVSRARQPFVLETLTAWARANGFGAVVWTDLSANFGDQGRAGRAFTPEQALLFLQGLEGASRSKAQDYIRRAPAEVDTPLRRLAVESGWLKVGPVTPPTASTPDAR